MTSERYCLAKRLKMQKERPLVHSLHVKPSASHEESPVIILCLISVLIRKVYYLNINLPNFPSPSSHVELCGFKV